MGAFPPIFRKRHDYGPLFRQLFVTFCLILKSSEEKFEDILFRREKTFLFSCQLFTIWRPTRREKWTPSGNSQRSTIPCLRPASQDVCGTLEQIRCGIARIDALCVVLRITFR